MGGPWSSPPRRGASLARPRLRRVCRRSIDGQILSITNDGLLSFKKVGGADGATLVPDLASALPEVSADRLTYRFPLREGIRYSTGDPVRPEDFRYALERVDLAQPLPGAAVFSAIDGAKACSSDPSTCDLSGSIADAGPSRSTSREPDPDLPFKLALPAAFPVPAATPIEDQGLDARPGDGAVRDRGGRPGSARAGAERAFRRVACRGSARRLRGRDLVAVRAKRWATAFDQLETGEVDLMTDEPTPEDLEFARRDRPGPGRTWPRCGRAVRRAWTSASLPSTTCGCGRP